MPIMCFLRILAAAGLLLYIYLEILSAKNLEFTHIEDIFEK